jgi:hypothetical protein
MKLLNKRGQSIAEYSILIALVIAAAIGIQTYVKRGWQGRAKDAADEFVGNIVTGYTTANVGLGSVTDAVRTDQFDPTEFARRSTQETLADKQDYAVFSEGTTNLSTERTTKANASDYQSYTYNTTHH